MIAVPPAAFDRLGHGATDGASGAGDEHDFSVEIGHKSDINRWQCDRRAHYLQRPGSAKDAPEECPCRDKVMAETSNSDVKKLPFEQAIDELETIVKRLEDGKVPLEKSVAIYERGEALKKRCEELLRQAEARVEKITLDSSGKPTGSEPLDVD